MAFADGRFEGNSHQYRPEVVRPSKLVAVLCVDENRFVLSVVADDVVGLPEVTVLSVMLVVN
jgi:hypothetical protein